MRAVQTDGQSIYRGSLPAPPVDAPPVVAALRHAVAEPGRPAIVDDATGESFSRAELVRLSAELATGLRERRVGRGDVVAVVMPNGAWWPVVALAVWRAGAVLAPLSTLWTAGELVRAFGLVRPRLVVASRPDAQRVRDALSTAGIAADVVIHDEGEGTPLGRLLAAGADPFAEPRPAPSDLAALLFSSGTGGLPKAVRVTHGNFSAVSAQVTPGLGIDRDSVVLAGAPFFHIMGLGVALCAPLAAGAEIVTPPGPETGASLELIARRRVSVAIVPPPFLSQVAAAPVPERPDSLEVVGTGGAHVPAELRQRVAERLGCAVRVGYGMTEAGVIGAPLDRPSEPEAAGWLAAGTEARLVNPETGLDAAPGHEGELWVRGPQVMDGYLEDPKATAEAITAGGWLRTGDLIRIRDDGQLVIRDRIKELIKVRGASVAPAEVELVLRRHRAVGDAAVVGSPHRDYGEVPVAYVVLQESASPEELISFSAAHLAPYKLPSTVRIVEELPRMPTGKLLRAALRGRERLAAR